jgi:hypothetical protein
VPKRPALSGIHPQNFLGRDFRWYDVKHSRTRADAATAGSHIAER